MPVPVPVPRLSRSCGCRRLPPPPVTPPAPAERSRSAPRPARPRPPPRPGGQRHPRGCPECPPLAPAPAEPGRNCRGWGTAGDRWPGTGRARAGKGGTGRTWAEKVKHRRDTARSRRGMARPSQSTGRMQVGHGQRRQDTGRSRQDTGKAGLDASKGWSEPGWAEAGHSQSRPDLLCSLADLAGHSSAPAPLAPEPPAHSQPSERGPNPSSSSIATNWWPRVCSPLVWPGPHSPSPQEESRLPALPHCPPAFRAAPSTQQCKHKLGKALAHTKTEALAGQGSRSPPLRQTLPRAVQLPRILQHCIPGAPSLRDTNGTGDDPGDRGTVLSHHRVPQFPPCQLLSLQAAGQGHCRESDTLCWAPPWPSWFGDRELGTPVARSPLESHSSGTPDCTSPSPSPLAQTEGHWGQESAWAGVPRHCRPGGQS